MDAFESFDVVDLVEDRQRQDLADAGNGAEPVKGLRVVLLGAANEMEFELGDDGVVELDQLEVDLEALARIGVGKPLGDAFSVGLVGDPPRRFLEVVLVVGVRSGIRSVSTRARTRDCCTPSRW